MFKQLIVYLAYLLKTSPEYRNSKRFFYDLLENPDSRLKQYFDIFMIALVVLSVFVLIYDMMHGLGKIAMIFENCVVAIFIVEYVLRGWLYTDIHKIVIEHYEKSQYLNIPFRLHRVTAAVCAEFISYVTSPFAVIDLLAILPSYRPLRILRVLLIFRLFKLFRYSQNIKVFTEILANKRFELYTLAVFMGFLIFISSTAFFMFEHNANGSDIEQFFDAVYWSVVTIGTVGYGDITPHTEGGRFVAIVSILIGLGVLGFFTSILVSAFNEKLYELHENRVIAEAEKYKNFIIVCGFGRVGQEVSTLLGKDRKKFIVIDKDADNVSLAKKLGFLAFHDDASTNQALQRAGIHRSVDTVLCTTGNDVINVYITLTSRFLNPKVRIIARANRQDNIKKMLQAGADHVIQPFEIAGLLAAEYIGLPVAFEAILGILYEEKHLSMEIVSVSEGSFIENIPIGTIDFAPRKLSLVGVISSNPLHQHRKNRYKMQNEHFYFNPEEHFVLHKDDILVLLGRDYSIDHFKDQVEKSRLALGKKA
ncbi:MAG: NAD-binding protein [Gammaproteobacteria bacterium]